MEQQIEVSLSIPVPEDHVLIKKVELQELKKNKLKGQYWTMKDLEKRTNKSHLWLKENILYRPSFRKELDAQHGGFVYYPESQGERWAFQAEKMAEFLSKNFSRIFKK